MGVTAKDVIGYINEFLLFYTENGESTGTSQEIVPNIQFSSIFC
jgi:hypothetical protein